MAVVKVGPFVIQHPAHVDPAPYANVLSELLELDWPWHVLACGSRGRVRINLTEQTTDRYRAVYFHADQSVHLPATFDSRMRHTIAHELGHAFEAAAPHPRWDWLQSIAAAMGADSWSAPGAPWHHRPAEGFAEWFAWWCGTTDATELRARSGFGHGPIRLRWSEPEVQRRLETLTRAKLQEVRMFPDVPDDHPHRDAIEWAAGQGLVEGKTDGRFDPEEPVTRGQLATILHRQSKGTK